MRRTLVLAVLLAAGCASGGEEDGGGEGITDFTASLRSTGVSGFADVRGSSRAVASLGNTVVTTDVERTTPGSRHPWHIHVGECGSGGPIVGEADDYPVLDAEDGSDRAIARIGVQLNDDEDYYVNIHRSPNDLGTIVACGALVD